MQMLLARFRVQETLASRGDLRIKSLENEELGVRHGLHGPWQNPWIFTEFREFRGIRNFPTIPPITCFRQRCAEGREFRVVP